MATKFTAPYQSIYDQALARQRESVGRARGQATRGAARARVSTSGVSQLPQQNIDREAVRGEADLGARVGEAAEAERLQDKAFSQRLQLWNLEELARSRERRRQRSAAKAGVTGQIIGGALSAAGSYLGRDK